jgi:hypothetical protein
LVIPELREVLEGGWHIDCEEAIPMTWGQQRAQQLKIMEMPPEISMKMLGLDRPNNMETMLKTLGNRDIQIPGVNEHRKMMAIINMLLQQQPVQQIGPDGAPMLLPSIPADPFEIDPNFAIQCVVEWSATPEAMRINPTLNRNSQNAAGYANVIAYGKEYKSIISAPPPMGPDGQPPQQGGGNGSSEGDTMPSGTQLTAPPPGGVSPEDGSPLQPEEMKSSLMEGA